MPTVKFTIPPAVEGGVQVYAYLLPDGTLLDKDYNLGAIDGNDAIKFDKILLAKAEDKPRVSQAEVDQVQQAIQYATRQRLNTL